MSSWTCSRCRTVYAVGIPACPHCQSSEYSEGAIVAKASAEGGATHYVAEGDPVPADLPPDVRLVGPGAAAEPEPVVLNEAEFQAFTREHGVQWEEAEPAALPATEAGPDARAE